MATVYVNDQPVEISNEENLNCIEAAARIGFEIPSYCWHPALSVVASCRMCLVEVGEKKPDGTVQMQNKLLPGCQTLVKDGTVVIADSEKVKAAQKATLEYLLLNHPLDCPTCDQAGECFLQDYSYKYGRGYSRLQEPKNLKPDKDHIGDQITLFTDRCIMCSRCVRFTREVSGTGELQIINRGTDSEIDIFPGQPCNNKLAGNVVDLCPVGALCSKDFLYKQRVWWLDSNNSVCPNCSTGCSISVDENEDRVYRLRPRPNPLAQGYFMCDEGRFGWKYLHADERLTFPEHRDREGNLLSQDWDTVMAALQEELTKAGKSEQGIAAVLSPWMTVEDAFMLVMYLRSLTDNLTLAMGPVHIVGEDDNYPKDIQGRPVEPVKFTIRAEKCPNRLGVQTILNHFGEQGVSLEQFYERAEAGEYSAAYLVGGDPVGWITDEQSASLAAVDTVVVQDIFPSAASKRARFILAGGSFAERDGTFVNHSGLAQEIRRAIRGPGEAKPDGRILWDLSGRVGLFNLAALRTEIATAIEGFERLAVTPFPSQGVPLELPSVAEAALSSSGNGREAS